MSCYRNSSKKRALLLVFTTLALALPFTGCGSLFGAASVPYTAKAGVALIRVIDIPGFSAFPAAIKVVPRWVLYGDGTLLYQVQSDGSGGLLQAHLQPTEVAHILDVVVNQDAFFADKKSTYGEPEPDMGSTDITVSANGQRKSVSLYGNDATTFEDQHMFSVLHFLQSYQPASARPYAAPGAIVVAIADPDSTEDVVPWPYPDISLQQIAALECNLLFRISRNACPAVANPGGYFPIYGKRGAELLRLFQQRQIWTMSQSGQAYRVIAWPLLPENMVVQSDGKRWVEISGMNSGKWPLLPGTH